MRKRTYNDRRRATYQYWRSAGKSPAEARKLRNAPLQAVNDYKEAKKEYYAFTKDLPPDKLPPAPIPPKIKLTERQTDSYKKHYTDLGFSKKIAHYFKGVDMREAELRQLQMDNYIKKIQDKYDFDDEKMELMLNDFKEAINKAESKADIFKLFQELYAKLGLV